MNMQMNAVVEWKPIVANDGLGRGFRTEDLESMAGCLAGWPGCGANHVDMETQLSPRSVGKKKVLFVAI